MSGKRHGQGHGGGEKSQKNTKHNNKTKPPNKPKNKRKPTTGDQNLESKTTSPGDEHQLQIHRHHNSCKTKVVKDFHSVYRSSFTGGPEHSLFIQRSLLGALLGPQPCIYYGIL